MRASSSLRPARRRELRGLPDATPAPPGRVSPGEESAEGGRGAGIKRILWSRVRAHTGPDWAYCTIWYFPLHTRPDLDRSERFYTEVLGLFRLADFGTVRILLHRPTSFLLALVRHTAAYGERFTELRTGLDPLGFGVTSREELVAWERRLDALGVEYTPIRDMEFGAHLNFRDPDHIALELSTSNATLAGWFEELRDREIPHDELEARLAEHLASSPQLPVGSPGG